MSGLRRAPRRVHGAWPAEDARFRSLAKLRAAVRTAGAEPPHLLSSAGRRCDGCAAEGQRVLGERDGGLKDDFRRRVSGKTDRIDFIGREGAAFEPHSGALLEALQSRKAEKQIGCAGKSGCSWLWPRSACRRRPVQKCTSGRWVIFEMILAECGRSSAADQKEASAQMHRTIATCGRRSFRT